MSEPMSCMKLTTRILAAIFALIFILTLPFGLLAFFTSNMIFNPEELTSALNGSLIESGALRRNIAELLSQTEFMDDGEDDEEVGRALSELTIDDWSRIVDIVISDEWLEGQIKEAVGSINSWLDDDRVLPGAEIDMRPIKATMQGESLFEIINLIVDSWPTCTQAQVDQMQQSMAESGQAPILYCGPPEPLRSELIDYAARRFQEFIRDMPASYSTFDLDQEVQNSDDAFLLKERIRTIRAFTMGGWLLSAALLGLIMVLAIRSWRDVAIWWGIPILVAGVLTILIGLSTNAIVDRVLQESTVEGSQALYDLLMLPVTTIRETVMGQVTGVGAILSVFGVGIMVVSYLFHRAVRPAIENNPQYPPPNEIASPTDQGYEAPPPSDSDRPSGLFG